MKPIHKVADPKNIRMQYRYIQVKNGFVYATDGYRAIKAPVDEVFPKDLIAPEEEIYFEATLWASSKMDKAIRIEREDLVFTAKDRKSSNIGVIKAISKEDMVLIGKFPDINWVLPNLSAPVALDSIGFDPFLLNDLCLAFGSKETFYCTFFGMHRAIAVRQNKSGTIGILMPVAFIADHADTATEEASRKETITDEEFEDLLG